MRLASDLVGRSGKSSSWYNSRCTASAAVARARTLVSTSVDGAATVDLATTVGIGAKSALNLYHEFSPVMPIVETRTMISRLTFATPPSCCPTARSSPETDRKTRLSTPTGRPVSNISSDCTGVSTRCWTSRSCSPGSRANSRAPGVASTRIRTSSDSATSPEGKTAGDLAHGVSKVTRTPSYASSGPTCPPRNRVRYRKT